MQRINLIPPELREASRYKKLFGSLEMKIAAGLLFLAIILYGFGFSMAIRYKMKISFQEKRIKELQQDLEKKKYLQAQIDSEKNKIEQENASLQEKITFLTKLNKEAVKWSEVLFTISKITPPQLWLNKFSLNNDTIVMRGETVDIRMVSEFMRILDDSGYFYSSTFNFTQKKSDKSAEKLIDFEVVTYLNR